MPTALLQSGVRTWHRARRRHCVMQQQQQQLTARSSPLGGGFPLGCCLAAVVLRGRARLFGKPQGAEARGDLWGGDSAPSKGLQHCRGGGLGTAAAALCLFPCATFWGFLVVCPCSALQGGAEPHGSALRGAHGEHHPAKCPQLHPARGMHVGAAQPGAQCGDCRELPGLHGAPGTAWSSGGCIELRGFVWSSGGYTELQRLPGALGLCGALGVVWSPRHLRISPSSPVHSSAMPPPPCSTQPSWSHITLCQAMAFCGPETSALRATKSPRAMSYHATSSDLEP